MAVETELERLARLLRSGAISADEVPVDDATQAQRAREVAAYRMQQAAHPEGGRQEGAISAALSDPALLFNMSPLGIARDTMQAVNEGDYGQAAVSAAPLAAPAVGPVVRGVGTVAKSYPKALASALAGLSVTGATSEAGEGTDPVKELQVKLRDAGFYRGPIDGVMGPGTQRAQTAFQTAEAERQKNETAAATAAATTKTAEAQAKLADAQMEAIRSKKEGNQRFTEMENEVPWYRQALRDYSTPAGIALGLAGGTLTRAGVTSASNRMADALARRAEGLFDKKASGVPARSARLNEFYRQGGAGPEDVPFIPTPGKSPGVSINPEAPPIGSLYQPSQTSNALTDLGITGAFGAEGALGQFYLVPRAREELQHAQEAVSADPSEVNIRALQAAKDRAAMMDTITNMGRAGAISYPAAALKMQRQSTVPSMNAAEKEKLMLEALLRRYTPKANP